MIRHYVVVVAATASAEHAVTALPVPCGWGAPTLSANSLAAWGLWASLDPAGVLLAALTALSGAQVFTWDDTTETYSAYTSRWQTATGWVNAAP